MERQDMAKKGLYAGSGVGIILFALFGLIPGSLIGGAIGLKLAGLVLGSPVEASVIARMIVVVSMIGGVLGSAVTFIMGTSVAGWAAGYVADALQGAKEPAGEEAHVIETH